MKAMRTVEASRLGDLIEELCLDISTDLPPDVLSALERARAEERSDSGRRVIDMLLENARHAREVTVPLCQDTGGFSVFLDLALDTAVAGDIRAEAAGGVARATRRGGLRASVVAGPIDERRNTGDNTPPLLEIEASGEEESRLSVMAKGGGCEMASRLAMLPPGAGWEGVLEFALAVAGEVGARSCPPLVLGVGVGGSFNRAPLLAKKALLSPLDRENPDPTSAERELELTRAVNLLGIGPGALGGSVTCMGTRMLSEPCHMATLPVAVSVNCHSLRRKTITL